MHPARPVTPYAGHDLSIVVPYRDDSDSSLNALPEGHVLDRSGVPRRAILRWLRRRYELLLPEAQWCQGDSEPGVPFNRAAARNAAYAQATRDLLLLIDADVVAHVAQIQAARDLILAGEAKYVIPYRVYIQMAPDDSVRLISKCDPADDVPEPRRVNWRTDCGNAGLMLITRQAWDECGGWDDRHVGWGTEDRSWVMALETIHHGAVRTDGYVLHVCHPRDPKRKEGLRDNAWLGERYDAAHYNPDAMRAVIRERLESEPR